MKKCLHLILLIILLTGTGTAWAADRGPMVWLIKDLAQAPVAEIKLRDERNRVVKTLNSSQIVYLHAVATGIQEVAELTADVYLLAGDEPNAFATIGENGENIIGINFAMLDLIGTDMHAAAAIIGHELAHLKLNHREESVEAIKRNQHSMITAANTRYSRDNEREADYLGMIWTVEAGYKPEGAVKIHEELYQLSRRRGGAFVGSHPSSIERLTVLKSLARRLSN